MQQHCLEACDRLDSRQFLIAVKKLANDLGYGSDRSPFLGAGIEYVQSRRYEIGDPIKSIDWRVTARTGQFHVKEYESPKRMPVYLLIDTSASMTIASGQLSKYAQALQIAGGIAFAALERISPVGVVGVGERDLVIKPSLSKDRILQWLHRLRYYRIDETTRLGDKLNNLLPSLASRALIITISDLHDPEAMSVLKLAAQKHDCITLQLVDPAEKTLRGAGFVRVREAETGVSSIVRNNPGIKEPESLADELSRAGIDHLCLWTNEPMVHKLRNFFKSRSLLGRNAR
ncbi:MAG: DUF58 domain-containing protein [Verrucomicrobiales bacterium]|nr:DUF58 domain-containing protein [Verrucomicrobiales bacterium]